MALHRGDGAALSRRFYVGRLGRRPSLEEPQVSLDGPLAQRIARVLRMRRGDEVVLFDGSGEDVRVRLLDVTAALVRGEVVGRRPGAREPRVRLHLYQSVTKGERFEWLIEKATEVGVACIVPLVSARAVVTPTAGGNRAERWLRIAVEAAEQSGRSAVPEIGGPLGFAAALATAAGVVLLPYESAGESAPSVRAALAAEIDALFALDAISVLIGPEGGFTETEMAAAAEAGASVVTLGQRVLRSETAGLVAAVLALEAAGELG